MGKQYRRLRLFTGPLWIISLGIIFVSLGFSTRLRGEYREWTRQPTEPTARAATGARSDDFLIRAELSSRLAQFADVISQLIPNENQGLTEDVIRRGAGALAAEAQKINPDDVDLIQRLMQYDDEVAGNGGLSALRALRRKVLKLNPGDIINQELIIIDRLGDLADSTDQLAAIDRFLSPAGNAIDDSVRSRLALVGASLIQENGRTSSVMNYLQRSRQLDPANINALLSLLQSESSPGSNAELKSRASLFIDWMKADPFDPLPALSLARLLNQYQSYGVARYLGDNIRLISAHRKRLIDTPVASTLSLSVMAVAGPVGALDFLDDYENRLSQQRQANLLRAWEEYESKMTRMKKHPSENAESANITPPGVPLDQVADIRFELPIGLNLIRLACARLADNAGRAKLITATIAKQLSERESSLRVIINDNDRDDPDMVVAAKAALSRLITDRVWLRVWLTELNGKNDNLFGSSITEDIKALTEQNTLTPQAIDRLKGWIAFRNGRLKEAQNLLTPLRKIDPQATLGLAFLKEAENDGDGAARLYAEVGREAPGSLMGIYSRIKLTRLRNRPPIVSTSARVLNDFAMKDFTILRKILMNPDRLIELRVEFPAASIDSPLYQPYPVTVTITNTSPFSLAVGEDRAVDSRVYLDLSLSRVDDNMFTSTEVSLGTIVRSLGIFTLHPGESTHISFRPDRSAIGIALREPGLKDIRLVARVYRGDPAEISTPVVTAISPVIHPVHVKNDALDFTVSDEVEFLRAAAAARGYLSENVKSGALSVASVDKLRKSWPDLSDIRRAYLLLVIPPSWQSNEVEGLGAFENEIAKTNLGRLTRIARIMTRVRRTDDPMLVKTLGDDDGNMKDIAVFIRELHP